LKFSEIPAQRPPARIATALPTIDCRPGWPGCAVPPATRALAEVAGGLSDTGLGAGLPRRLTQHYPFAPSA